MDKDLENRRTLLGQNRIHILSASIACSEIIRQIYADLDVLKSQDEDDNTSLQIEALQVALNQHTVESIEKMKRFVAVNRECQEEEREIKAYLAQRQSDPPKLVPAPENDSGHYYFLLRHCSVPRSTFFTPWPEIMKWISGLCYYAKNLICRKGRKHPSQLLEALLAEQHGDLSV